MFWVKKKKYIYIYCHRLHIFTQAFYCHGFPLTSHICTDYNEAKQQPPPNKVNVPILNPSPANFKGITLKENRPAQFCNNSFKMGVRSGEKRDFFFSMYCMGMLVTTDRVFSRELDIYIYMYIFIIFI